jgi:hypothetical protein
MATGMTLLEAIGCGGIACRPEIPRGARAAGFAIAAPPAATGPS